MVTNLRSGVQPGMATRPRIMCRRGANPAVPRSWECLRSAPMLVANMTTIGFIGSGHIGGTVAALSVAAGYDVVMSNSRGPSTLVEVVRELGDGASAGAEAEAARDAGIVVVSIPCGRIEELPVEPLAGRVVIETNNYYAQRDGHYPAIDSGEVTSSELLQRHLPDSRVVKVFNNIMW